jgi:hypothetical protein
MKPIDLVIGFLLIVALVSYGGLAAITLLS